MPRPQTAEETIRILERVIDLKTRIVSAENEMYTVLIDAEMGDAASVVLDGINKTNDELRKTRIGLEAVKKIARLLEDERPNCVPSA
jgi:hypothetical protein